MFSCLYSSFGDHSSKLTMFRMSWGKSKEVLGWSRPPTAYGNTDAFTRRENRPRRAVLARALVYVDFGVDAVTPSAIRAPLEGGIVKFVYSEAPKKDLRGNVNFGSFKKESIALEVGVIPIAG